MTEAKPSFNLKHLPLRTKAVVSALIVCGAVILVTTLFIVIQILRIQVDRVGDVVSPEAEHHEAPPPPLSHPVDPFTQSYELQGMSISLGNRNQTLAAYAEFNLILDCPTKDSKRWMEMNRASIRDAVYEATVLFTVEDFSSGEGFSRMKKSIVETLKSRFGAHAPREVAIQNWIIR